MSTSRNTEQSDDAFGFGPSSAKERIRQIKPSPSTEPPPDLEAIDTAADNIGFVSREAPSPEPQKFPVVKFIQRPEATIALNMRAPVSLADSFKDFCSQHRYSYPEGLGEIMRKAGLLRKQNNM